MANFGTSGVPTAQQSFLLTRPETVAGTPNAGQPTLYRTDITGGGAPIAPAEQFDLHTPDGLEAPLAPARVSQMAADFGPGWRPQYGLCLIDTLEMSLGNPYRTGTLTELGQTGDFASVPFRQYRLPEIGAPRIVTRTLFRGRGLLADIAHYGRVTSWGVTHARNAATGGTINFAGNQWQENQTMPGGTNEVQSIASTGSGGSLKLTLNNPNTNEHAQTGSIAFNADAATVQTALRALDVVQDPTDITCAGGPLGSAPVTVTFSGNLAKRPMDLLVADETLLTGGTTTITATTPGVEPSFDLPEEPLIERTHWRTYKAEDLADLLSIDSADDDDTHYLRSVEGGGYSVGNLNVPHWVEDRLPYPAGHVGQTPAVAANVLVARQFNQEASDLFNTVDANGCNTPFYLRQAAWALCGDEINGVWFDLWGARAAAPTYPTVDNYLQYGLDLTRVANLADYNDGDDPWGSAVVTVFGAGL